MNQSGSNSGSRVNVPEARGALDNMKFEIARELGINFKQGYNGDLTSRENGYVGGYMVKRLIEQAENQFDKEKVEKIDKKLLSRREGSFFAVFGPLRPAAPPAAAGSSRRGDSRG